MFRGKHKTISFNFSTYWRTAKLQWESDYKCEKRTIFAHLLVVYKISDTLKIWLLGVTFDPSEFCPCFTHVHRHIDRCSSNQIEFCLRFSCPYFLLGACTPGFDISVAIQARVEILCIKQCANSIPQFKSSYRVVVQAASLPQLNGRWGVKLLINWMHLLFRLAEVLSEAGLVSSSTFFVVLDVWKLQFGDIFNSVCYLSFWFEFMVRGHKGL